MTIEKMIFGISPGARGRFAFVPVAATVNDRRLSAVADARDDFPTEGNIYVDESNWIPAEGIGAIWRVRGDGSYSHDRRHAEFSAFARGREGPLEIISVPVSSAAPNSVRRCLCEGLELGYVAAANVLVRLEDGVVIGPVRTRPYLDGHARGISCAEESFAEPFSRWDDVLRLDPFLVDDVNALARRRRSFVSYLDLPEPQSYFDAAAFADSVKSVLKAVQVSDPATAFSKRQLAALTRAIADGDLPDRLRTRASRVLSAIRSVNLSREELEAVLPAALDSAQVGQELSSLKQRVEQEERQRIRDTLKADIERSSQLQVQIQTQEARSRELESEIAAGRAKVEASIHVAAEQLSGRLQAILDEPEKLLAEVAILRPLLSRRGDASEELARESATQSDPHRRTGRRLATLGALTNPSSNSDDVFSSMECALRMVGLLAKPARSLSREVLASLAVGQIPMFRGSLGRIVARCVAQALCGENVYVLPIPIGVLDSELVRREVAALLTTGRTEGQVPGLVIEGMDRSPVEVYGDEILQMVGERVMAVGDVTRDVIVIGTISGGPGSLPISDALCDLGPIVDTDTIRYSRTAQTQPPAHAGVSSDVWLKTTTRLRAASVDEPTETLAVATRLDILGSALWRRGVAVAASALTVASPDDEIMPRESLLCDWLIPRAIAEGGELRRVAEQARIAAVELEVLSDIGNDGRVSRLLARLEREHGNA